MKRQRRAFLPRVEPVELRLLPGQLFAPLENLLGGAGSFGVDSQDPQLLSLVGDSLPADPVGQHTDFAENSEPIVVTHEPASSTFTVFALGGLAEDLDEEADLLQGGRPREEHALADANPDSHATCAPVGCGCDTSACGPHGGHSSVETPALSVHGHDNLSSGLDLLAGLPTLQLSPAHDPNVHGGTNGQGEGIHTPHDHVPDFGANPTIFSVQTGAWSDPTVWSPGRTPRTGDVVAINPDTVVTYDLVSSAWLRTLVVTPGGRLQFRTGQSTRLMVGNFLVKEGGQLEVGSAAEPIYAHVQAEIVITDQALDTAFDPQQYGTGLIVWGQATMHGAAKGPTFARLAVEPRQGDTTLTFEQPVTGWTPGDALILPPTTPVYFSDLNSAADLETEELIVQAVNGNVVTLTDRLRHDHRGAYDAAGNVTFLPHVGNLTRNVVIRSANPEGTRGHTMFTHRADVDLRYVQFKDLGRTQGGPLDNTTFDEDGNPTHIGTNQIGRYAFHAHHLWGPENLLNQGSQFELVGNVIDGGRKWGMALHNSHYGLIRDNIVYDTQEAGIVTEDGTESFNVFEHNFVVRVGGDQFDFADGFWIGGPRNYFRYNVVASVFNSNHSDTVNTGTGYHLDALNGPIKQGTGRFPLRRGADMDDPYQAEELELTTLPLLEFRGNEGYAMDYVFWNDHHVGPGVALGGLHVQDLRAWAVWNGASNAYGGAMTFDSVTVRKIGRAGFLQQSAAGRVLLRNVDIQDTNPAVMGLYFMAGGGAEIELVVENATLRTAQNVVVTLAQSTGAFVDPSHTKRTVLRNVRFAAPDGLPLRALTLQPTTDGQVSVVPVLPNTIQVFDYQGRGGENFQVFFREQHPYFIVPYEGDLPDFAGVVRYAVPERGLTNVEAIARYSRAMAGGVAPCTDDTSRPEMEGFTCT